MVLLPLTVSAGEAVGAGAGPDVDPGGAAVARGSETVHDRRAGDRSDRRPLTARTRNVWRPSVSPEYVAGEVQSRNRAPSREHRKVERLRVDLKPNDAVAERDVLPAFGPLVIRVFGAFPASAADAGPVVAAASASSASSTRTRLVRAQEGMD
jgi:hypothetical protein